MQAHSMVSSKLHFDYDFEFRFNVANLSELTQKTSATYVSKDSPEFKISIKFEIGNLLVLTGTD